MNYDIDYVLRTVEERDIRFIRLWFTDVLGFLKSFAITPAELEAAFDEGMGFDGSAIEGFARVQESDTLAKPDPSTFQILPWRPDQQGVARMFCDILTPEGEPFAGDPRAVLRRQIARAQDMGFTFYLGPELEYFYFKDSASTEKIEQLAGRAVTVKSADGTIELAREGASWEIVSPVKDKVDPDKLPDTVVCYLDSTVALPLLTAYALAKRKPRELKKLYHRRETLVAAMKKAAEEKGNL